jgi:hypothetical protein
MNYILIILLFLAFLVVVTTLKLNLHVKNIKISKKDRKVLVDDVEVEYSDLQHYINTRKDFENRKSIVDFIIDPTVVIENDQMNVEIPEIINHHINTDVQNVHDNTIQKNIKGAYSEILQTQQNFDKDEILGYVKDEAKKEKISEILDKITKRNSYVTNLNSNEVDVIKNVWFNGNDNVKNQAILEILDCVDENNVLYCPTGVTSRIASALYINNPDKFPKTRELLNQEVITTFGKYFREIPDKELSKEKTINDYYKVYDRDTISSLVDEWIDYV